MTTKRRSRKHMLLQQSPKVDEVHQRLTVRVPKKLYDLVIGEVAKTKPKISRNRWVSSAIIGLRDRYVVSRLELPLIDKEGNHLMTDDEAAAVKGVNNGLATLVSSASTFGGESESLPIRFTEEGVDAFQDLIRRIHAHQREIDRLVAQGNYDPDDDHEAFRRVSPKVMEKLKTLFVQIALWEKVVVGDFKEDPSS